MIALGGWSPPQGIEIGEKLPWKNEETAPGFSNWIPFYIRNIIIKSNPKLGKYQTVKCIPFGYFIYLYILIKISLKHTVWQKKENPEQVC